MRQTMLVPCLLSLLSAASAQDGPGIAVGTYLQDAATRYGKKHGLPGEDVFSVAVTAQGQVYAGTEAGLARFAEEKWAPVEGFTGKPVKLVAARGEEIFVTFDGALVHLGPGSAARAAPLPRAAASPGSIHGLVAGKAVYLATDAGLFELKGRALVLEARLAKLLGKATRVRGAAMGGRGDLAVAAEAGLFLRRDDAWEPLHPQDGAKSWAPRDVRAVAYDRRGRLWFASPQGAGCREGDGDGDSDGAWKLYTGFDGLPYDDFTSLAGGDGDSIWLGTRRGAIRFDGAAWEYRQGRRWLPHDEVRTIAVTAVTPGAAPGTPGTPGTAPGAVWFATAGGVGRIERRRLTLAEKAHLFEEDIDKRHRRTPYGYVLGVSLEDPDDLSRWTNHDSDNDGLWTSMYGAGECFAWAATRDPEAKRRARQAFEALCFLGTVTQGGSHPAPPGFVARTILPASGPDPNLGRLEHDRRERESGDRLWKVIDPRWPLSADGKWYWKSDTSSDELDGHYFFYALYHDLVADTEEEKGRVRQVVAALTDLMVANDFNLIDHDGRPTRWGRFGPRDLNQGRDWWEERGLNSLSMLSYLRVAEHVTGGQKYAAAAKELIEKHGYHLNVMYPKSHVGPGSGNQSDDEMAFMGYYNLIRYEKDPALRQTWAYSFWRYWHLEAPELNPFFNFTYAAVCATARWEDAFGTRDLAPRGAWLEDAVDSLKRFPLDRRDWRLENSHRKDIVPLRYEVRSGRSPRRGHLRSGRALPIDERYVDHWSHDPWNLDQGGSGRHLASGASFLLPYYMGLYHGFVR